MDVVFFGDGSRPATEAPKTPGLDAPRLTGVAAMASYSFGRPDCPQAASTRSSTKRFLRGSLEMSGDEGGMASASLAGRRIKLACVDGLEGVPPATSPAGDALLMNTSLWLARGPVDGTRHPMLDGGIKSSEL